MQLIKIFVKGISLLLLLLFALPSFGQLGVNSDGSDPDASAMLDVKSVSKGVLIPRMTELEKINIPSPATGLLVFQTNGASGFYYYDGTQWVLMGDDMNHFGIPNIFLNDFIVWGNECIGFDCVNGEVFGFSTLKLKQNNVRIKFDDTSTAPGEPNNDWSIEANEYSNGGLSAFFVIDSTSGQRLFTLEANAGDYAFYVDNTGNTGIGTNTPGHKLHVNGNIHADGNITATGNIGAPSDARLKKNVQPLERAMDLVGQLEPKRYDFRFNEYPSMNLPVTPQIGLIAQEVEAVLPELVKQELQATNAEGTAMDIKSINYVGLIPILLKGMQEQQTVIEQQQAELSLLKEELAQYQALKNELEVLFRVVEENGQKVDSANSRTTATDTDEYALKRNKAADK